MDDLYARIMGERGKLESLTDKIPGFKGYSEMSARRQADRLIREHIAEQLKQQLNRLPTIERQLLEEGGLSSMSKTRSAKAKLQTLVDRIATDTPGYSGFFDAVKIDAEDLEVAYAFDKALIDYVDKFKAQLDVLQDAALKGEGVDEAIRDLDALTIEANDAYSLRDSVIKGLE